MLELGSGIGTLTYVILRTVCGMGFHHRPDFVFYTVETDEFCLEQLVRNLDEFAGYYRLAKTIESISPELGFDLVVVDGGGEVPTDTGLIDFGCRLQRGGVIFVEGSRRYQRQRIAEWYGARSHVYAKRIASRRTMFAADGSIQARNKNYHVYVFEPTLCERVRLQLGSWWNQGYSGFRRRLEGASTTPPSVG